jgi:hypothetical protein
VTSWTILFIGILIPAIIAAISKRLAGNPPNFTLDLHMKITQLHVRDFSLTLLGWGTGGFIYSMISGREFDWVFNLLVGSLVSAVNAVRLHKRRFLRSIQQRNPADA